MNANGCACQAPKSCASAIAQAMQKTPRTLCKEPPALPGAAVAATRCPRCEYGHGVGLVGCAAAARRPSTGRAPAHPRPGRTPRASGAAPAPPRKSSAKPRRRCEVGAPGKTPPRCPRRRCRRGPPEVLRRAPPRPVTPRGEPPRGARPPGSGSSPKTQPTCHIPKRAAKGCAPALQFIMRHCPPMHGACRARHHLAQLAIQRAVLQDDTRSATIMIFA